MLKNSSEKRVKVCKVKRRVLTVLVFNTRLVLSWFILGRGVYKALGKSYSSRAYKKKQCFW
jgi:hypothetical protein